VILLAVLLAIFAAGIGMALSAATVYFRDLPYLWTIVIQVWFFLTPIVYDYNAVKDKVGGLAQTINSWNPRTGFIRAFRHCLFDGAHPDFAVLGGLAVTSFVSLICGTLIFVRLNRRLAEEA
jgi:ABC-type polysaccharide/polyol phosphate export permease